MTAYNLRHKIQKCRLKKFREDQCQHLTIYQQKYLLQLLQNIEDIFDGNIGTRKIDPIDFELKENAKPVCSRTRPVPKVHE